MSPPLGAHHRLLIVGGEGGTHIGGSLRRAAEHQGLAPLACDSAAAFAGNRVVRAALWRLLKYPSRLGAFSSRIVDACSRHRPTVLIATGLAPISAAALERVGQQGVTRVCWLTDDPWNAAMRSRWAFDALRRYDFVFTPRKANLEQLRAHCSAGVSWLPFAYDESLFFPEAMPDDERRKLRSELLFVGGADSDRLRVMEAVIQAGLSPALYGGYWGRHRAMRPYARGLAAPSTLRRATCAARINLCLVRRANRDGHVMRTFEIAACRGVPLLEDTAEHRELFGPAGEAALYFRDPEELVQQARFLMNDSGARERIAAAAHQRMTRHPNTYGDRLRTMLDAVGGVTPR